MSRDTWAPDEPTAERLAGEALPGEAERYELLAEIGRGGMGRVRRAKDLVLGRLVAYKEVTGGQVARFVREARLTARLDHPGIVPVYDAGVGTDGTPFYTMRLLDGRTLEAVLAEPSTPAERLGRVDLVVSAAQAVAFAHRQGVVHQDLKPANLMVGALGDVQVVDWGLAVDLDDPAAAPTGGTPGWCAPEQRPGVRPGPPADVWALGWILAEVLQAGPDAEARHRAREAGQVVVPAPLGDRELDAVLQRATAADPAARYPDAGALLADLEAWRRGQRVSAYVYSPRDELVRLVAHFRRPLLTGGALAAVAAGVGAWGWWSTTRVVHARTKDLLDREVADVRVIEALVRAAEILDEGPDADAMGVWIRWGSRPPVVWDRAMAPVAAGCESAWGTPEAYTCASATETWRVVDGREAWRVPGGGRVARTTGDVVVWGDGTVRLLAASDGATRGEWDGRGPGLSPDGRYLGFSKDLGERIVALDGSVDQVLPPTGSQIGGGWWDGESFVTWRADGTLQRHLPGAEPAGIGRLALGAKSVTPRPTALVWITQTEYAAVGDPTGADSHLLRPGVTNIPPLGDGIVASSTGTSERWGPPWRTPRWRLPVGGAVTLADRLLVATPDGSLGALAERREPVRFEGSPTGCEARPAHQVDCFFDTRVERVDLDHATVDTTAVLLRTVVDGSARSDGWWVGDAQQLSRLDSTGAVAQQWPTDGRPTVRDAGGDAAWVVSGPQVWQVSAAGAWSPVELPGALWAFDAAGDRAVAVVPGAVLWLGPDGAVRGRTAVDLPRAPIQVEPASGRLLVEGDETWVVDGASIVSLGPGAGSTWWLSPDHVARTGSGVAEVFDAHTGELLARVDVGGTLITALVPLLDTSAAPDGTVLAVLGSGVMEVWDLAPLASPTGFGARVRDATGFRMRDGRVVFDPPS